jgi:hypothetical protein
MKIIGKCTSFAVGGNTVKVGSSVIGLVVDFSDGVVNVSLKPELVDSVSNDGKKKVIIGPSQKYTCLIKNCLLQQYFGHLVLVVVCAEFSILSPLKCFLLYCPSYLQCLLDGLNS